MDTTEETAPQNNPASGAASELKLTERMRATTRKIHDTADALTNVKVALACTDRYKALQRYIDFFFLFGSCSAISTSSSFYLRLLLLFGGLCSGCCTQSAWVGFILFSNT